MVQETESTGGSSEAKPRSSLKSLFSSNSSSTSSLSDTHMAHDLSVETNNISISTNYSVDTGPSHRFLLRRKNSKASLSPQTSSSSLSSLLKRGRLTPERKKDQDPEKEKDHSALSDASTKQDHNTHNNHHLSLKRFLKKFIHHESSDKKPILPLHTSSSLYKKYGEIGKLVGSGASGSVNLVTSKDNPSKILAVKKFRAKLPNEMELDYKTKVKNEFRIGLYLTHENLIHTIELIKEHSHKQRLGPEYYIVMEYCPFDFFNLVMSGLMGREEVACYFKQISNGVHHLHINGIAHRDLKLDNCVVTNDGILKLIDFGSAVQFSRPKPPKWEDTSDDVDEEHRLIRAKGVVGSDPYLAPEVFEPSNFGYDPRAVDVWSIAVIFCCMCLKRFPWKIPKASDPSYRSFANIPDEDVEKSMNNLKIDEKKKAVKGPDRLLRLLPTGLRFLVQQMLAIDPKQRLLMDRVVEDPYFESIAYCHVVEEEFVASETKEVKHISRVEKADNHEHHLVTEEDLKKIELEKERTKKLKNSGVV